MWRDHNTPAAIKAWYERWAHLYYCPAKAKGTALYISCSFNINTFVALSVDKLPWNTILTIKKKKNLRKTKCNIETNSKDNNGT